MRARETSADGVRHIATIHHRHAFVHQHDIGPELAIQHHSLLSVAGLGDYNHVRLFVHDRNQAYARDQMIFGNQDSD